MEIIGGYKNFERAKSLTYWYFFYSDIAKSTNLPRRQGKSPSLGCDSKKEVDVLRLVSQKLSNNVTWLVDNNLPPLMEHSLAERNFVKLDNVFVVSIRFDIAIAMRIKKII